jgi:hypothetical protein
MADRREQILALLATRHDHLPLPARRDGTAPGFVHRTLAPTVCPTCDGLESAGCPSCRGRGQIEVWRSRDPYATDRVTPYGLEATAKIGHVAARDAELARLAEQTAPPPATELDLVADANEHPYRWELERRAMYARFDYAALDRALERLAGLAVAPHSERGLRLLERWLPDPLRAPRDDRVLANAAAKGRAADPRARAQRDRQIRRLVGEGSPTQWVAREFGLTVSQVNRIVAGAGEATG